MALRNDRGGKVHGRLRRLPERFLRAGVTAAFVDLDRIGFCHPARTDDPGNHRLKARNLTVLWRNFRAAGAERLIVVGPVEDEAALEAYAAVLPAKGSTLCRLHAGHETLIQRIRSREHGGSWVQPGDPLRGRSPACLARIAGKAIATADDLERAGLGDLRIDTDQQTAEPRRSSPDPRGRNSSPNPGVSRVMVSGTATAA